jgi:hypothetical protein
VILLGVPRATYSTTDMTDPLNAEIDNEIYIDTKDLCKRVAYELKQHSIPQAIFAERILCRSQGTLSDLLRNPKPWNRLKSGRETFRRMYNWLQQPLNIRLSILDMYKGKWEKFDGKTSVELGSLGPTGSTSVTPPTPAQNSRHHHRIRRASAEDDMMGGPGDSKRPRLVFTDIQKRTLQVSSFLWNNFCLKLFTFRPFSKKLNDPAGKCNRPLPSISVWTFPRFPTFS